MFNISNAENPTNDSSMGSRIRLARKEIGYTIDKAAELLDISTSYFGLIEHDGRLPSLKMLMKICSLFGISADYLITGKDNRFREPGYLMNELNDEQYATIMLITTFVRKSDCSKKQLDLLKSVVELFLAT